MLATAIAKRSNAFAVGVTSAAWWCAAPERQVGGRFAGERHRRAAWTQWAFADFGYPGPDGGSLEDELRQLAADRGRPAPR